MKVDAKGNVFATGPGGVLVLDPAGKHLGSILTGVPTANCGWGDDGSYACTSPRTRTSSGSRPRRRIGVLEVVL